MTRAIATAVLAAIVWNAAAVAAQQSADERMHAQRIVDHLVERDQKVKLPAVAAPPMDWKTAEALCAHVLQNEKDVTASINNLYAMAEKAKDPQLKSFASSTVPKLQEHLQLAQSAHESLKQAEKTARGGDSSDRSERGTMSGAGTGSAGSMDSSKSSSGSQGSDSKDKERKY